ncbi:hypothetical protein Q2T40_06065 [Winogradskyella maritima]|uniref:Uncharacterized protein n=1 Tax=Winogradskyella maritima TaxID=1517766 RepID=A0ABV8AIU8_9FLAO|nr:hypothetical protein [Winogradskyella maritima]
MIALRHIIKAFSPQDKADFISFVTKKNKRGDTKNVSLFKLLHETDLKSKQITDKLYGNHKVNAYHALRKRLFSSLIDFKANKSLQGENSVDIQIIKYLLAARTFLLQKEFKTAYYILDKAEELAQSHLLYPILNEIYHTKIQYAYGNPSIDIVELIEKQKSNSKKHQQEDALNLVYAQVQISLNKSRKEGEIIDVQSLIQNSLHTNQLSLNESLSFKSLYQLLSLFNISAFVTNDYLSVESFALKTYDIIESKPEINKQLFYQINCLYIVANVLFRNFKFEKSLDFINKMEGLMMKNKKEFEKEFILKSTLIKALNYHFSGQADKAIAEINSVHGINQHDKEAYLDLELCRFMIYMQIENYDMARTISSKLFHTDDWYISKAGVDWVMKKNLTELFLYHELDEDDIFSSRLKSFKRKFKADLSRTENTNLRHFLKLLEKLNKVNFGYKEEIKHNLNELMTVSSNKNSDIFEISFYSYFVAKIEQKPIYETTQNFLKSQPQH